MYYIHFKHVDIHIYTYIYIQIYIYIHFHKYLSFQLNRAKKSEDYSGIQFCSVRTIFSAKIHKIKTKAVFIPIYTIPDIGVSTDTGVIMDTDVNTNVSGSMDTGVSMDTDLNTDFNLDLNSDTGDGYYRVDIVLDGALYKMIRNIIGGCLEVGYGTMSLDELKNILDEVPSRALNRIVTAPACGLYLEHVNYREKLE